MSGEQARPGSAEFWQLLIDQEWKHVSEYDRLIGESPQNRGLRTLRYESERRAYRYERNLAQAKEAVSR
jgi:hypothetical protein